MKILFTVLLAMSSSMVLAQSGPGSPYSFGGACGSQGTWTQNALEGTQHLQRITAQLRDDANCTALGKSLTSALTELQKQIDEAEVAPENVKRLSQIPGEISALRNFSISSTAMKKEVLQLMMDRAIQGATISAGVGPATGMASSITDLGTRLRTSTSSGLNLLNQVMDEIPRLNECLIGDQEAGIGAFIAMSTKTAAAFAGSGQDGIGTQLATTISKIANFSRDTKFSKVMRKLNQQEFMSSMACLMEITSESYCQTRDAMGLFKHGMDNLTIGKNQLENISADNPFAGYYILNIHVPNVTKWLQKIQIGVDPKLPTDAQFQNKILDEVVDYQKTVKTLLGEYNISVGTIRTLGSLTARQNGVLTLISKMVDTMLFFTRDDSKTNFFKMNKTALELPFYLLGMEVPDVVAGRGNAAMPQPYDIWLQANYQQLPLFKDPVALTESIGHKMRQLIHETNISSIEYFNKWFIVDKPALVSESVIDVQYTVKESLEIIEQYLGILQGKMVNLNGERAILPTILDTRDRIVRILDAYDTLTKFGEELKYKRPRDVKDTNVLEGPILAYEKLINIVYEEFEVQLARSGFLANRMTQFVYKDYILLVRNKISFTEAQQDLFNALGLSAIESMLQIYSGNPANVLTDLNMALRINKGNIDALELLLKDSIIETIEELKLASDGGRSSLINGVISTMKENPLYKYSPVGVGIKLLLDPKIRRAAMYSSSKNSPESEFEDAKFLHAQMCIQGLAFVDQKNLRPSCTGVKLESPLKKYKAKDISYDQKLNAFMTGKDADGKPLTKQQSLSLNHSERICAFRDYNRETMVLYMTMGRK